MLTQRLISVAIPLAALLALARQPCAAASAPRSIAPPAQRSTTVYAPWNSGVRRLPATPIQHVIYVMQENRSFDDLWQGYPKADTKPYGYDHLGKKIKLQPIPLEAPYDIDHTLGAFLTSYDGGKMDGFDEEYVAGHYGAYPTYGYVPHYESAPYFKLAHSYVLGDRMFTSHIDASFVSHQYMIAGQAYDSVDLPYTNWGCTGNSQDYVNTLTQQRGYGSMLQHPCFSYTTLGQELDNAGLPWRLYAYNPYSIWDAYQAIQYVCMPSGSGCLGTEFVNNVITPETQFVSDVQNGKLAAVTWITPNCYDSDHGGCQGNQGPLWVTSIVDAVGQSQFWDSTAIFVMWDEWGGWYDHVPPPYVDYDGLGMRVGLLIVSPYAKENYVSHVQYEHGSILKFIEDTFGLPRMSASDTRANSPAGDAFDFKHGPRKFKRFDDALTPAQLYYRLPEIEPADAM